MNAPKNKNSEIIATVKNCLFIISGNAELLLGKESLTQEGKKKLGVIREQVFRIDKLLEKIE